MKPGSVTSIRSAAIACVLASLALLLSASNVSAGGPQITGEITAIENRPPDDLFGFPGLYLLLRVDVTHPQGLQHLANPPAGASAVSNNNNFPFAQPVALTTFSSYSTGTYFLKLVPIAASDFSDIEGRYTYQVTDDQNQDDQQLSHRLNRPEVVPLPTNLAVSNHTPTPIFTFTDPNPTPGQGGLDRHYSLLIVDSQLQGVAQLTPDVPQMPVFTLPAGMLCPCEQYYLRAESLDIDSGESAIENLATAFLPFVVGDVPHSADLTHDCRADGRDVQRFVDALFDHSTNGYDLCAADFNNNGMIDVADVPGFTAKLVQN